MIARILPLCDCDFSKVWNTIVHAIDSSLYGWGTCVATRPRQDVARAGGWNERWRYKCLDPQEWAPCPRVGFFEQSGKDPLSDTATCTEAPHFPNSDIPRASEIDWKLRSGFPDPPPTSKIGIGRSMVSGSGVFINTSPSLRVERLSRT